MQQGFFSKLSDSIRNLIFPQVCLTCGEDLKIGEGDICMMCRLELAYTDFEKYADNDAEKKFWGRARIHSGFAAFYYRKQELLQKIVHDFKYHNNRRVAIYIGKIIGRRMKSARNFTTDYDYLVPVPLHPHRLRKRGYNQSQLIAEGISEVTGMKIDNTLIERVYNASSQTKKNRFERWDSASVSYALAKGAEERRGIRVLLVDDVLTTGATIESCCQALENIPDVRIGFVTVGIASR